MILYWVINFLLKQWYKLFIYIRDHKLGGDSLNHPPTTPTVSFLLKSIPPRHAPILQNIRPVTRSFYSVFASAYSLSTAYSPCREYSY